jgi:hypothetical protein
VQLLDRLEQVKLPILGLVVIFEILLMIFVITFSEQPLGCFL